MSGFDIAELAMPTGIHNDHTRDGNRISGLDLTIAESKTSSIANNFGEVVGDILLFTTSTSYVSGHYDVTVSISDLTEKVLH